MKSIASWGLLASILSLPAAAAAGPEIVLQRGAEVVVKRSRPPSSTSTCGTCRAHPIGGPGRPDQGDPAGFRPGGSRARSSRPADRTRCSNRASRLPEIPTTLEECSTSRPGVHGRQSAGHGGDVGVGYYIQTSTPRAATTVRIHDKTDGSWWPARFILDHWHGQLREPGVGDPVASTTSRRRCC